MISSYWGKIQKEAVVLFLSWILLITFQANMAAASVKLGASCPTLGQRVTSGNQTLVCVKIANTGVWAKVQTKAPNVVGMGLPHAEAVLNKAKFTFDEHPLDGAMGIIVKENWIVCKEVPIGTGYVRLDVAKYGC